jgi:hypothetical protein
MNEEAADVVIGVLVAAFRTEIDEDQRRLWRNTLALVNAADGLAAAEAIAQTEMWFPKPKELTDKVRDIVADRIAQAEVDADIVPTPRRTSAMPHCDGTRWIDGEPCPRCNPRLFALFGDRRRWLKFLSGTPADRLLTPDMKAIANEPPCAVEERWEDDGTAVGQLSRERIAEIVTAGIAEGRAERLRNASPEVRARLEWWAAGGVGHWPGCPCDVCKRRLPLAEVTEVGDRLRAERVVDLLMPRDSGEEPPL